MKILVFSGGLGNQIFEYAFYCWLKEKYPKQLFYGIYNRKKLSEHNGLEINKWFNVKMPPTCLKVKILTAVMYIYKQIYPKTKLLDLNQRKCINYNAWIYYAFKLSNKYIPKENWIRWKVNEKNLSEQNKKILDLIKNTESVFIHVRRGDYLSDTYKTRFEGTCPIEYYEKAIRDIEQKINNPHFFCFSDDIEWTKNNLTLSNVEFVDWNIGINSPLDMYLMSQCKYAIIANSTFSFWGAMLGKQKEIVYYPTKWINSKDGNPQIFPVEWKTF